MVWCPRYERNLTSLRILRVRNANVLLKCFEKPPEATRNSILKEFNLLNSVDMQNTYLCVLISVLFITHRKPGNAENAKKCFVHKVRVNINYILLAFNVWSFKYTLKLLKNCFWCRVFIRRHLIGWKQT